MSSEQITQETVPVEQTTTEHNTCNTPTTAKTDTTQHYNTSSWKDSIRSI